MLNAMKKNYEKYEVLQLVSTKMCEAWKKEFNYVLSWRNLKVKIITNMVRKEIVEGKEVSNYYAGV